MGLYVGIPLRFSKRSEERTSDGDQTIHLLSQIQTALETRTVDTDTFYRNMIGMLLVNLGSEVVRMLDTRVSRALRAAVATDCTSRLLAGQLRFLDPRGITKSKLMFQLNFDWIYQLLRVWKDGLGKWNDSILGERSARSFRRCLSLCTSYRNAVYSSLSFWNIDRWFYMSSFELLSRLFPQVTIRCFIAVSPH